MVDLDSFFEKGIFSQLKDPGYFSLVKNNGYFIAWPNDQELSADTPCVVKQTLKNATFTHDLTKLAKITGLNFSEDQLDSLDTITTFHLNARYDSFKKAFYQKCTYNFTKEWIDKIETLRLWIKEELMK